MREETSNFKEASILFNKIVEKTGQGLIQDKELFVFTDNSVFESTWYKGHSSSRKLNDMILELRMVERDQ